METTPPPFVSASQTPVNTGANTDSSPWNDSYLGTLTMLNKRIKVKVGVDSATLKNNVGWMPTSARPGEDGLCVIMGHRNQELRVMKDIAANDIVTIETQDGQIHSYSVYAADSLPSENELRFDNVNERELRIVNCYPFYYRGNAPQKFVLKAVGI